MAAVSYAIPPGVVTPSLPLSRLGHSLMRQVGGDDLRIDFQEFETVSGKWWSMAAASWPNAV